MNQSFVKALLYQPYKKLELLSKLERNLNIAEQDKASNILRKLTEEIKFAYNNSMFYKKQFAKINPDRLDLLSIQDIEKLPFTTKRDLEEQYPFGMLATEQKDVIRYNESLNIKENPISAFFSRDAWFENNVYMAFRLCGIFDKNDLCIISVNYELSALAQEYERVFELIGLPVISCGIQNENCSWDRLVEILKSSKASVLVCSFVQALLIAEAIMESGYDLENDFNINKIIVAGEFLSEFKCKRLGKIFHAQIYGVSSLLETGAIATSYIDYRQFIFEDRFLIEVINRETLQPVLEGERGELVVTPLTNNSMPLIRYRTGKIVSLQEHKIDKNFSCSKVLSFYGNIDETIEINQEQMLVAEVESLILSSDFHGLFYKVDYGKSFMKIYIDLSAEEDLKSIESKLKGSMPESWIGHVSIEIFQKEQRKEFVEKLKDSINPSNYIFSCCEVL